MTSPDVASFDPERLARWTGLHVERCRALPAEIAARIERKRPELVRLVPDLGGEVLVVKAGSVREGAVKPEDLQGVSLPGYRIETFTPDDTAEDRAHGQLLTLLALLEESFSSPEAATAWMVTPNEAFGAEGEGPATPLSVLEDAHPKHIINWMHGWADGTL